MPITTLSQITPLADLLNQKAQAFTPDSGFPASISVTGTPAAVLRYTITSVAWPRRFSVSGSSFLGYTQANDIELGWFNGSTPFARAQQRMVASVGGTLTVAGYFDLASGASAVLELRVTRVAGTGIVTNSIGTYSQASVVAVPN